MSEVTNSDLEALDREVAELEAKVNARQELVEKIVTFVEAITLERGEVTKREVRASNTCVKRQLKHFGDFSFSSSSGHNLMGGNDIEVWHHPTSSHGYVFRVYYQVRVRECEVLYSQFEERWLPALLALMEHKDELIAQAEQEKAEARERELALQLARAKRAALLEWAGKLKLEA